MVIYIYKICHEPQRANIFKNSTVGYHVSPYIRCLGIKCDYSSPTRLFRGGGGSQSHKCNQDTENVSDRQI